MLISGHVKRDCGRIRLHPRSKRLHSFKISLLLKTRISNCSTRKREWNFDLSEGRKTWKQETISYKKQNCLPCKLEVVTCQCKKTNLKNRFYKKSMRSTKYAVKLRELGISCNFEFLRDCFSESTQKAGSSVVASVQILRFFVDSLEQWRIYTVERTSAV